MKASFKLQTITTAQVRAVAAAASRCGVIFPRVKCEGPEMWGLEIDMIEPGDARILLEAAIKVGG